MMGMDNDPVEIEIHQTTFHQIKSHETNHFAPKSVSTFCSLNY